MMKSRCYVTAAWKRKLQLYPFVLRESVVDGMREAMDVLESRARRGARWNEDGTDTGKWLVTGTARQSISGYVRGDNPEFESFDIVEPKYKTEHRSPMFSAWGVEPMVITGVLTMTEQHSADLQAHEIKGSTSGLSPLGPGKPITSETMETSKDLVWWLINKSVREGLKVL
jgi:hypothetical protein